MQTTITGKGQVTIPRHIRQYFGLRQGMVVSFTVEQGHIAIRPVSSARPVATSGFGLIQSELPAVPADLDVAALVKDQP